jgi:hypothetical protein
METANLMYHFCVIAIALVVFCLKITAPNDVFEFILKSLGKIVPLFVMAYAIVQIFKHFAII